MTAKLTIPVLFFALLLGKANAQSDKKQGCALLERPIVSIGTCLNDSIIFDAGSFTNAKYSWDFDGDGIFDIKESNKWLIKHQYLSVGSYLPQVVIFTDSCTIGNRNETKEKLQILSVIKPVFRVENKNCNTIKLERIVAPNTIADSIVWSISDGSVYRTNLVEHTFAVDNGSKFEVSLSTFKNTCSETAFEIVEFENVVAQPVIELSSNCAPAQLSVRNKEIYQDAKFTWYINGEVVNKEPNFLIDINEAAKMQISLAIANKYGCADSIGLKKEILVGNPVIAHAEILENAICFGDEVELIENNKGHNFRTVLWGDGTKDTLLRAVNHQYQTAGAFEIKVIAENTKLACVDTFVLDKKVVVYYKPEADFEVLLDGSCTPQVLEVKNNSNGFYTNYNLVLDGFDTLRFDDALIVKNPGIHEVRLQLLNKKANCKDDAVEVFKLFNPMSKALAPAILETSLVEDNFSFSWAGFKNTKYFEIYKIDQNGQSLIANTNDTAFTVAAYNVDSSFSAYAVKAYDQCGVSSALSANAQAIALKGFYEVDSFPTLQWDAFTAWNEDLTHYVIEKNIGNNWQVVGESKQPHYIDKDFDNNETLDATYRVKAVHINGMFQSISTEYKFNFLPNIYVPSAFSPNYDNVNDEYIIKGQGMKECTIKIFNSWGQMIYESKGENNAWDGKYKDEMVEAGTYVCVVAMQTPEGRNYSFERTVTLIR